MNLLKSYKSVSKLIKELTEKVSNLTEERQEKETKICYDIYQPKIKALEKEMVDKINELSLTTNEKVGAIKAEIKELNVVVQKVRRIFQLVQVVKDEEKDPKNLEVKVYFYSDRDEAGNYTSKRREVYFQPVKVLFDDEYRKINVYLVQTEKPVNKYALIIRGKSIFENYRELIESSYGYVGRINGNASISVTVKEGKTEKELLGWLAKNEQKVIAMCPVNFEELVADYGDAKELIKEKQWQVAYLEYRKFCYEHNYSHGTEKEEYKQIIKELKKVK